MTSPMEAEGLLDNLDRDSQALVKLIKAFLIHPWLLSLWTLQEMVLRSDAWILFDDGLLSLGLDKDGEETRWSLHRLKMDIWTLWQVLKCRKPFGNVISHYNVKKEYFVSIWEPLEALLALLERKGLDASDVKLLHTVYFIAQRRRVSRPLDRIYGIVQTYGISCDPNPPGDDKTSRLHALEDEFGTRLRSKSNLNLATIGP